MRKIWQDTELAFDPFVKTCEPQDPQATMTLLKGRTTLMALYDVPATY